MVRPLGKERKDGSYAPRNCHEFLSGFSLRSVKLYHAGCVRVDQEAVDMNQGKDVQREKVELPR